MVDRICISINQRCNLSCRYCHFCEKGLSEDIQMDVLKILKNVKAYAQHPFKIGFVGNGEPLLDYDKLKRYILYLAENENVSIYTITNGTVDLADEEWKFLEDHRINVGFSIDGPEEIHNLYRGNTFQRVLKNIEKYKQCTGHYPTFNATVGKESLDRVVDIIAFFKPFGTRITFSRMIGSYGISLEEYKAFIHKVDKHLSVRRGALDCTMYGGMCGAGANNFFFSNGKVYLCGNCIDLPAIGSSEMTFEELERINLKFDRAYCYKEAICE